MKCIVSLGLAITSALALAMPSWATYPTGNDPAVPGIIRLRLPVGATGDRPGTPVAGDIRYNSTTNKFEGYDGAWKDFSLGSGGGVSSTATFNTAAGTNAFDSDTGSSGNTAFGYDALTASTSGNGNTAYGAAALATNSVGSENTAIGFQALNANTDSYNTAVGHDALYASTSAGCTAVGRASLSQVSSGAFNTGLGSNTAINLTTGTNNTVIGRDAGGTLTSGSYNLLIGCDASVDVPTGSTSNYLNLGNAIFGTGIQGGTVQIGIDDSTPSATLDVNGDIRSGATSRVKLAVGTTAQRPGSPETGDVRYNTDTSAFEGYNGSSWGALAGSSVTITAFTGAGTAVAGFNTGDTSGGAFSITLPTAASAGAGARFGIKKIDSSANALTIARSSSDTIDGATSFVLTEQYQSVSLISDGTSSWYVE